MNKFKPNNINFNYQLLSRLSEIINTEEQLNIQLNTFGLHRKTLPIECDRLGLQMRGIENTTLELCQYFSQPKNFPSTISVNRYTYVNDCFIIRRQASEVECLSSKFRTICSHSTMEKIYINKEICYKLHSILDSVQRLKKQASELINYYNDEYVAIQN